jgi:hypothetical protein
MPSVRLRREDARSGNLPRVCMVCGDRAEGFQSKTMSWYPGWVFILLLAGLLPFIIVALIVQKKMRVQAPFCPQHERHWSGRTLAVILSFVGLIVVGIGAVVLMAALREPGPRVPGRDDAMGGYVCMAMAAGLIGWLILVAILQTTAIRPKEITDDSIILTGVSRQFKDALEDAGYYRDRPPPYEEDRYYDDRGGPGRDDDWRDDRPRRH